MNLIGSKKFTQMSKASFTHLLIYSFTHLLKVQPSLAQHLLNGVKLENFINSNPIQNSRMLSAFFIDEEKIWFLNFRTQLVLVTTHLTLLDKQFHRFVEY
jgi:hypothetical protein